jgi:hypothetical protein
MRQSFVSDKTASNLSDSVRQQLTMYSLAAGAAGVGLLALAQPSEAKVVYTPAHVKIATLGFSPIDFNHDGKIDVGLWRTAGQTTTIAASNILAYPNTNYGNGALVSARYSDTAVALRAGAKIGPNRKFSGKTQQPNMAGVTTNKVKGTYQWGGQWANGGKGLKNRYLGVKFIINGQFHYGWARVTVVTGPKRSFYGVLTGYAYETIANKAIVAGQTKGFDDRQPNPARLSAPSSTPSSLGVLATGASGLSIWRGQKQ